MADEQTEIDAAQEAIDAVDPDFLRSAMEVAEPALRTYFRLEESGVENVPAGGALIVSNHSGGLIALDVPVFAVGYYHHFGFDEPFFSLAQGALFQGPQKGFLQRIGLVEAHRKTAHDLLSRGRKVLVFPGGDYDAARPVWKANVIDFGGRTGYVRTAVEAGVPIVPMVTVGGQETSLFFSRGERLVELLGIKSLAKAMPLSIGFPFGFTTGFPPNIPLPAKLQSSILAPVDPKDFGKKPSIEKIDEHIRTVMQAEVDRIAATRRFPIIG